MNFIQSIIIILIIVAVPDRALAYLDMGSGSYFLQILIASLLSVVVVFGTFWRRFVLWIKTLTGHKNEPPKPTPEKHDE